jgi:hypothetical protein
MVVRVRMETEGVRMEESVLTAIHQNQMHVFEPTVVMTEAQLAATGGRGLTEGR